MAMTNFGTNDPLAVNLWSKSIDVEALKHTDIFPLTGMPHLRQAKTHHRGCCAMALVTVVCSP
jgi:hypothetical protein